MIGATKEAAHAHLVEYGTVPRRRGKHRSWITGGKRYKGGSTGTMPALHFMRSAWNSNKDKVLDIFVRTLQARLIAAGVTSVSASDTWETAPDSPYNQDD